MSLFEKLLVSTKDETLLRLERHILRKFASELKITLPNNCSDKRSILKSLRDTYPLGEDELGKTEEDIRELINNHCMAKYGAELLAKSDVVFDTESCSDLKEIERRGETMVVGSDDEDEEQVEKDLYIIDSCSDMKKRVRTLLNLSSDPPSQPELKRKKMVNKESLNSMVQVMRQVPDLLSQQLSFETKIVKKIAVLTQEFDKKFAVLTQNQTEFDQKIAVLTQKLTESDQKNAVLTKKVSDIRLRSILASLSLVIHSKDERDSLFQKVQQLGTNNSVTFNDSEISTLEKVYPQIDTTMSYEQWLRSEFQ